MLSNWHYSTSKPHVANRSVMCAFIMQSITLFALPSQTFADEVLTPADYVNKGASYETGETVTKDFAKAAEYYRLAAEAGSHQGMHNLGFLYNTGNGVQKNRQKAIQWWRKASQLGNAHSSFNLGNANRRGDGVDKSYVRSLNFYFLSYQQGYLPAICQYAMTSNLADRGIVELNEQQVQTLLRETANIEKTPKCMNDFANLIYENNAALQKTELMLRWAEKAAEANNSGALFLLGRIYHQEYTSVAKNPIKAREYYLKAAEQGIIDGYSNLGVMYAEGDFGQPDHVLARKYYEKAIEMGSTVALNNLGVYNSNSNTKIDNHEKAIALFRQSAAEGSAYAHRNLGSMYHKGEGVEQDSAQAKVHFETALALGEPWVIVDLAMLYADASLQIHDPLLAQQLLIDATEKEIPRAAAQLALLYTGEQREFYAENSTDPEVAYALAMHFVDIAKNEKKACVWFAKAFERRQKFAYLDLIRCVEKGLNFTAKYKSVEDVARDWAEFNGWDAESLLGELYYYGEGVSQDFLKAAYYFEFAIALTKDVIAMNMLGDMYRNGEGVNTDFKKAYDLYQQSGDGGHSLAFYNIGMMYKSAQGVQLNEGLAFSYMKRAAEFKDSGEAMFEYAKMLNSGYSGVQDISESHEWFERASQAYENDALCELGKSLTKNAATDEDLLRGKKIMKGCE